VRPWREAAARADKGHISTILPPLATLYERLTPAQQAIVLGAGWGAGCGVDALQVGPAHSFPLLWQLYLAVCSWCSGVPVV
jgi:hypothetical protein